MIHPMNNLTRWSDLTATHQYRLLDSGVTPAEYNARGHLDNSWRERAACRGVPSDDFVPPYYMVNNPRAKIRLKKFVEEAAEHCGGCPVRQECLEYGRATKSFGVFGGVLLKSSRAPL